MGGETLNLPGCGRSCCLSTHLKERDIDLLKDYFNENRCFEYQPPHAGLKGRKVLGCSYVEVCAATVRLDSQVIMIPTAAQFQKNVW